MLTNNPGTLEQWNTFISEYESNLAIQKTALDAKLNDGTLSDADKKKALEDYSRQESYLQWLKTKRDEYEATGEIPSDMSFDITANGDLYRYNGQIHVATLPSLTSYTGTTETLKTINIGTTLTTESFDVCSSPDCNINLTWGGSHLFDQYTHESLKLIATYAPNAQAIIIGVSVNHTEAPYGQNCYMAASASGTWVNASGYTPHEPVTSTDWNETGFVKFGIGYNYETAPSLNDIPTWSDMFYGMFDGPAIWQSFYAPDELFARRYCSVSYSGDLSNTTPWDFYNDDILPNVDPDDAVFPDGYHIADPHDPSIDPDLPDEDEGNPPSTQDTKIITSPSWFITQYILNQTLLESLGKTLWSSWLDSNSNVWENFLFDYFQQTGTFNITAALDYIISLRVYPFDLHAIINPTPPQGFYGQSDGVYMGTGKTNFTYSSGVTSVKTINSVSGYLYMGECEVKTDYPYSDFRDLYNTTIQCYLPYCGMVELNPVDVWGKTLSCHYYIDFQSGGCTAIVKCPTGNGQHTFPVASKSGQIGFTIPLTATNAGQLAAQFIGDATRAVGTIAGMGFSIGGTVSSMLQGNVNTADASMGIGQSVVGGGLSLANQAANMLSRPGVNMPMLSGGSGCESLMMYPTPFITIRRGRYAKPENFPHSVAFANATSGRIGDYKGMNCFTGVDASGLTCHADEKDEIIGLLQSGVYLPE